MYENDCALKMQQYFDRLGEIAHLIFEGEDPGRAAATKGMSIEEFKDALFDDIRPLNLEAFLVISSVVLPKDEYLEVLAKEFWPKSVVTYETSSKKIDAYIKYALKVFSIEEFKNYLEKEIKYKSHYAYSLIKQKI